MTRYPRPARNAAIKHIPCNAPVTKTVDGDYVCVKCGTYPITRREADEEARIPADD